MVSEEDLQEPVANRYEDIIQALPGRILPKRYRIDQLLSASPYTAIYRTFNEQKETVVNLRVFRILIKSEEDYQYRRFKQEVKKLISLNHENIAKILDHGLLEEGLPYIVVENIEGPTLSEVLVHQNRMDAFQTGLVFSQIAKGVQFAHDQGILHETLKPSRIIITETEESDAVVKITGFGLLSCYNKLGMSMKTPATKAAFIGSAAYMSPEQCYEGLVTDGRSDIYSIGCMMYEALSGQVPFLANTDEAIMQMHLEKEPTPIPVLRKDLTEFPKRLLAIVDKCMVKDPTRRYQFVKDLQFDIERDIDPEEREKRTVIPEAIQKAEQRVKENKESPVRFILTIVAACIGLFAVVFGGYYLFNITSQIADNGIWQTKLDAANRAFAEGKTDEAIEGLQAALNEAKKFPAPDMRMAKTLNDVAYVNIVCGRYTPALNDLRSALLTESRAKAKDPETEARTNYLLSEAELAAGKVGEAEQHAKAAVQLAESLQGENTEKLYRAYQQLFRVMHAKNDLVQAKIAIEKMKTAFSHTNVMLPMEIISGEKQAEAQVKQSEGKLADAEKGYQDVLGSRQDKIGPGSLPAIETYVLLGKLYVLQNKYDKSIKILTTAMENKQKMLGEKSPAVAELCFLVALVYDKSKNYSQAEKYYRQSLEMAENDFGKGKIETLPYVVSLAKFLREHKQISAAQVYETEALEIQHPERVPQFLKEKK